LISVVTSLAHDLDSIHHDLGHRLSLAAGARPDVRHPRDHYTAIDTFLAAASRHNAAMVEAIEPLVRHLPDGHDLAHEFLAASRAYEESLAAPTRPHPWIPHQGVVGHLARAVARRIDTFWDSAEGRMVPEPVRHHDREHQGPLTQYLLADPHLPDEQEQ
jgi:hypothetical protein